MVSSVASGRGGINAQFPACHELAARIFICPGKPRNSCLYFRRDLAEFNAVTSKSGPTTDSASVEQQLRADNDALRAELRKVQAELKFQKYRRRGISKMLRVGFWEWNHKTRKPISYSSEMADVLGVDAARLEQLFKNILQCRQPG